MAHMPNTQLPLVPSADGKWLKCPQHEDAYWGAFRPTVFIAGKFAAHVERKHKADKAGAEAGAEAPAADHLSDHADFIPNVVKQNARRQAANARKAKAGVDGAVRIIREAGPQTRDLLGDAMADILNDMGFEIDPRLQLAQGPRMFADEGGDAVRAARRNHMARNAA